MPQWGWIIIFATATPLAVLIVLTVIRRGGRLSLGKNSIVIHGDGDESKSTAIGRALKYVPDNIGQVHGLIYARYLRLVKQKGIDEARITELEDARFARSLLRIATSMGNGSNSVMKIIESQIIKLDFAGKDLETYVRSHVAPRAIDTIRNVINSDYDSMTDYADHSPRTRVVSQVEFVDMLLTPEFRDDLVEAMLPFFTYARDCLETGCKDR